MTLRTLVLTLAALSAPALGAQEAPRFGLQAGLNLPQADLKDAVDDKVGVNIGAHMALSFKGGHMLRPRVDYTWFPEHTMSGGGASVSVKFSGLSLGSDYLYFVDGTAQGLYFTGGLALIQWKAESSASFLGSSASGSETTTKLGVAAGLGYQFNRTVGAELRYQTSKAWEGTLDTLQAGVTLRF